MYSPTMIHVATIIPAVMYIIIMVRVKLCTMKRNSLYHDEVRYISEFKYYGSRE